MCILVIAGVSGNLTWVPDMAALVPQHRQATAAVVFVVVYVGVAQREREARQRAEALVGGSRAARRRERAQPAWRARSTTRSATT